LKVILNLPWQYLLLPRNAQNTQSKKQKNSRRNAGRYGRVIVSVYRYVSDDWVVETEAEGCIESSKREGSRNIAPAS
jgi:hypothetical protein